MFGHNTRKLNQEASYLGQDRIELIHEYKYLGIDFYSHDHFNHQVKRQIIASMKVVMNTLRKEVLIGVTCWEPISNLLKALVLPTFTYSIEIWGGDLKNSHWNVFEKGMTIHMMSHVNVQSLKTRPILFANLKNKP